MKPKIKYAPALKDLTIENDDTSNVGDEGMEAVLFQGKDRRKKTMRKIEERSFHSSSIEGSMIHDIPQNLDLLDMIENERWEVLLHCIRKNPQAAHLKITGRSLHSTSSGNLVLHEACKHDAPIDVVEAIYEANKLAISTKGHCGYLPLHCACAHNASIEVINYLLLLHPDSIHQVETEEGALPLHLSCRVGTTETIFMALLMSYPDAVAVRDDFGRLPIDYAKSIRNDEGREIAIECLHRANWLESASKYSSERTEREYLRKIRGYEQFQAQRLKMIEEVHKKQIAKLEEVIESQNKELSEQSKDVEEQRLKFKATTAGYRNTIESLEVSMKTKTRKLRNQLDKVEKETAQNQVALDLKKGELAEASNKLDELNDLNKNLTRQLSQRNEELEIALEDIDTLNRHSEWLESLLGSIRDLANKDPPLVREMEGQDENQSLNASGRVRPFARDNSIRSSIHVKPTKRGSIKDVRKKNKFDKENPMDQRDAPIGGRVMESARE